MKPIRSTVFISDLHLQASNAESTSLFFQFLKTEIQDIDALYILGDLFEAWIGDDDRTPFHNRIEDALRAVTEAHIPSFFVHGNRDFLIGKRFAARTGITLLKDPCLIDLYGKKVLLSHGDMFCTADTAHQKYRKIMFHPCSKKLLTCIPLWLRRRIAQYMRKNSRSHQDTTLNNILNYIFDVIPESIEPLMHQYDATLLIHGHTHRPATHAHGSFRRIVLGDWDRAQTRYLRVYPDGQTILTQFS